MFDNIDNAFTEIAMMYGLHISSDYVEEWRAFDSIVAIRDELKDQLLLTEEAIDNELARSLYRQAVFMIDLPKLARIIWRGLMAHAVSFELRSMESDEVIVFDGVNPYDIINDWVTFAGDALGTNMVHINGRQMELYEIIITKFDSDI